MHKLKPVPHVGDRVDLKPMEVIDYGVGIFTGPHSFNVIRCGNLTMDLEDYIGNKVYLISIYDSRLDLSYIDEY